MDRTLRTKGGGPPSSAWPCRRGRKWVGHVFEDCAPLESIMNLAADRQAWRSLRYSPSLTRRLRTLLDNLNFAGERMGLHLNLKKTKVISNTKMTKFEVRVEKKEMVEHLSLLGSMIEENGSCKKELSKRLALGRAALTELSKIWKDKGLKIALVFPLTCYESETWTISKAHSCFVGEKISAFEM